MEKLLQSQIKYQRVSANRDLTHNTANRQRDILKNNVQFVENWGGGSELQQLIGSITSDSAYVNGNSRVDVERAIELTKQFWSQYDREHGSLAVAQVAGTTILLTPVVKAVKSYGAGAVQRIIPMTAPLIPEVANASQQTISHIMQEKHAWNLVTNPSWENVSQIVSQVMQNGVEKPYGSAFQRIMQVNGQQVVVTFAKLANGIISISSAWVQTK